MIQKAIEPDVAGESRLEDLVGYHLRRASVADMNDFVRCFRAEGLRPIPFSVLCAIDEQPGTTSAEICRILGLQRANIVSILAEFDERGLIERHSDPNDQRIQRLSLSAEAKSLLPCWRARVVEREEKLFHTLTAGERRTLCELLARVWKGAE